VLYCIQLFVTHVDILALLANEEIILQGMTDRLTEIGRRYGMEMNVERTKVVRISSQPSPINVRIDQKQLEKEEYFKYLGSMVTNDTRYTGEIKSRIAAAKAALTKKKALFTRKLGLNLSKKLVRCYIWSVAVCGAAN
jgi:hypothetical protein